MLDLAIGLFAQAAGGGTAPAQGAPEPGLGGGMQTLLIPMGIMLFFMWIFLLRPAQKQEKDRKKAIYLLKRGDDVTFSGGILGTVASIKEKTAGTPGDNDEVTVKVLDSKLRILRSSIHAIVPASEEAKEPAST